MAIKHTTEKGFALLLSIIISSVVLAIGLTLLNVTLKQLSLSTTSRESEIAFQMAGLGLECANYWRDVRRTDFLSLSSSVSDYEGVSCGGTQLINGGGTPPLPFDTVTQTDTTLTSGSGTSNRNRVTYKFDVPTDSEDRCVQVEINIISPSGGDFSGSIGRIPNASCPDGAACTFIISQGHNRSCAGISSGDLFTVQREITAEY